jgi:DNA polymerase V
MSHVGIRINSGRKTLSSLYKEKTSVIRVPNSIKPDVLVYLEQYKKLLAESSEPNLSLIRASVFPPSLPRPIYSGRVSAGQSRFPSPAQDYEQEELDLNKHLVTNPPATFFYRVGNSYDSMIDVGILPDALLIVDRSITPKSSHIVLAEVDKELVVKRLYKWKGIVELRSENKDKNYPPITFREGEELIVFGVVTFNVNALK